MYLRVSCAVADLRKIAVTVEEIQAHIEQLLSRVYIESLATGNLSAEVRRIGAYSAWRMMIVYTGINSLAYPYSRSLVLPSSHSFRETDRTLANPPPRYDHLPSHFFR